MPSAQIIPQQPLDRLGHQRRRAAIAHRPRNAGMFAHRSAQAEVERVGQLAFVLDLLAFEANVGDPVLAAAVRAACDVQLQLLIELRQPLFELIHQPAA